MKKELKLKDSTVENLIDEIKKKPVITEFAHTPSFFHVGIYRTFLNLFKHSQSLNTGILFCINDHLSIKSLSEIRRIPFKDNNNIEVRKSPLLGIEKKYHNFSLNKFNPPSIENITKLCERIAELFPKKIKNILNLQNTMNDCSYRSTNLANWFINLIFKLTNKKCIVFPTSKYNLLFNYKKLDFKENNNFFFRKHCVTCGCRLNQEKLNKQTCNYCKDKVNFEHYPNVILRQNLINQLNVKYRICGRKKSYQDISDAAKVFTKNVPERIYLEANTLVLNKIEKVFTKFNIIQLFIMNNSLPNEIPKNSKEDWKIFLQ